MLALYLLGFVAMPDFAVMNTSCQKDNEGWRENGTSADRCHNHGAKILKNKWPGKKVQTTENST